MGQKVNNRSVTIDARLIDRLRAQASRNWRTLEQEVNALIEMGLNAPAIRVETVPSETGGPSNGNGKGHVPAPQPQPASRNRSGFRGVYPYGKRWVARIVEDGKPIKIGVYDTPEEAARAWDARQRTTYEDQGFYNFPENGENPVPPQPQEVISKETDDVICGRTPLTAPPLPVEEEVVAHYWSGEDVPDDDKDDGKC